MGGRRPVLRWLVWAVLLVSAPAAQAANVEAGAYRYSGDPYGVEGAVGVFDTAGEVNTVTVHSRGLGNYAVTDATATLTATPWTSFGACVLNPTTGAVQCVPACPYASYDLLCTATSRSFGTFFARLGPGNDRVVDIAGLRGVLDGGPGRDTLTGGPDYDIIHAEDGEVDVVRCGGDWDEAYVDPIDVLPDGSCELRH